MSALPLSVQPQNQTISVLDSGGGRGGGIRLDDDTSKTFTHRLHKPFSWRRYKSHSDEFWDEVIDSTS